MAALYQIITSIETPDERTVVITLREPSAPFLSIDRHVPGLDPAAEGGGGAG